MKHLLFTSIVTIMMLQVVYPQDRITGMNFATRSEVIAQNGMAATSHPLATQIAIDILKQGGSAVDAAIAANAALGLMEPTGCGIGGDLFAIVWDAESKGLHGLNASGRSPKSLTIDHFANNGYTSIPQRGPLSLSVPGTVDGMNLESGFPYETTRTLMTKGHTIQWAHGPFGGYQAIMWDPVNKVYYGASESRKDGQAAGY